MDNLEWLEIWMEAWDYELPGAYHSMKKTDFTRQALNYWAATEVIEEVKKHPRENIMEVLNNFRDRMDCFSCIARTEQAKIIFISLYDAATDAIDFLIGPIG